MGLEPAGEGSTVPTARERSGSFQALSARTPSKAERLLADNGGVALVVGGVVLVGVALVPGIVVPVATALAVMGAAMIIVGCLLPNIEGTLKVGPGGVEAVLRAVEQRAVEKGLDEDDRASALGDAFQLLRAAAELAPPSWPADLGKLQAGGVSGGSLTLAAPTGTDDFAERILKPYTEMEPVDAESVPQEAIDAVRAAASDDNTLNLVSAARRMGRGAPRWHLHMNDGSDWRVSNTVHGWNATPLQS